MERLTPEKYECIEVGKLTLPPWNWKRKDPARSLKIAKSLERFGQLKNIVVRQVGERYEVLDGAEIMVAAKTLNMSHLLAYNLGVLSNDEAKVIAMSVDLNKMEVDILWLAKHLKEVALADTQVASTTPYSEEDLQQIRLLLDFKWGIFDEEENPTPMMFDLKQGDSK